MHAAGCACGVCKENSLRLLEKLLANLLKFVKCMLVQRKVSF